MFRNVIFDLDGTLIDTGEGVAASAAYAAEQLGLPALSQEALKSFVGPPLRQSFIRHYGLDEAGVQEAVRAFRAYYSEHGLLRAAPYDGMLALCERLQAAGVRMGVATYKREDYALRLLHHFGFDRCLSPICGADAANTLTKADILHKCQALMQTAPADCVLIGDTAHDAQGAAAAGTPFLAVTYGFGFRTAADADEYPCIGTAASPAEIYDLVMQER